MKIKAKFNFEAAASGCEVWTVNGLKVLGLKFTPPFDPGIDHVLTGWVCYPDGILSVHSWRYDGQWLPYDATNEMDLILKIDYSLMEYLRLKLQAFVNYFEYYE
jgi:hypothetical protein